MKSAAMRLALVLTCGAGALSLALPNASSPGSVYASISGISSPPASTDFSGTAAAGSIGSSVSQTAVRAPLESMLTTDPPETEGSKLSSRSPSGVRATFASTPTSDGLVTRNRTPNSAASPSPPPAGTDGQRQTDGLRTQVQNWIAALSTEKGFESWKNAEWTVTPLGPGTGSWLVSLEADGKEAGYLIVGLNDDGSYGLREYGSGPNPLFSMNTLRRVLAQRGLIALSYTPYYTAGLEAFWKVETTEEILYFDAKSGELLPDLTRHLRLSGQETTGKTPGVQTAPSPSPSNSPAKQSVTRVMQSREAPLFDPFDDTGWLQEQPCDRLLPENLSVSWKAEKNVTFTAKLYRGKALYPFAVTGYHSWSHSKFFIRLDHEGPRYVELAALSCP